MKQMQDPSMQVAAPEPMLLFSRLPPDVWYQILQHLRHSDMLALAATCRASAEAFRNPPVRQHLLDPGKMCDKRAHVALETWQAIAHSKPLS
jgi:F-box domain